MQLFRVHRLPLFQAPDAPASDPPPPDPVVTDPPAAADPPAVDPPPPPASADPPAADPPAADGDPPKQHGNKGRKPWYLDRISEESAEKAREREARVQAERERDEARALLERLQKPGDHQPAPRQSANEPDVETRAREIAEERLNADRIRGVVSAGVAKFDDWDQRAEMLAAVGAASPAFVLDVATVDSANAHEILHRLADDPDKAARLAKMDSRSRTIELVKMSMALQNQPAPKVDPKPAPAPKTVSRAPAPPPPIEPAATETKPWWDDKSSDAEFSRGWEENARQRAQRGRR